MARPISNAEFFANVAILAGRRSEDPNEHLGACLVNAAGEIVSVGTATLSPGFSWQTLLPSQKPFAVCSAETNAVIAAGKKASGCTAYLLKFPSFEGAKVLVQAGVTRIVCLQESASRPETDRVDIAKQILEGARVACETLPLRAPQPSNGAPAANAAPPPTQAPPAQAPPPKQEAAVPATAPPPAEATASAPQEPVTPQQNRQANVTEFFAPENMSLQECARSVVSANDGDYLIRKNEKNECVLVVKDSEAKDKIRMYTMKPDGTGKWLFGNHVFPSMKSVVKLLQVKPIKSKTGKMIRLGVPAPGGVAVDEPGPSEPSTPAVSAPHAGGDKEEEEGCVVM
eukprot:m.436786 g.436786  ORF g.436786 m.436786 type:complete len:342 (-) comp18013_c0_seq1:1326-2351(-)